MNRRGFGLLAMLGFCCFLGICLCTSAYYYYQLVDGTSITYTTKKTSKNSSYRMKNDYSDVATTYVSLKEYHNLELRLKEGARQYTQENPIINENRVIISLRTLQSKKIIDSLYDSNRYQCNGYVIYDPSNKQYTPYLRCGTYRSADYVNRLE